MGNDISLELAGGLKVLNPQPIDDRNRVDNLTLIADLATLYIGFFPILNLTDGKTYIVSGGDASTGWTFEEFGGGTSDAKVVADEAALLLEKPTMEVYGKYIITLDREGTTDVEIQIKFESPDGNFFYEKISNLGIIELIKVI